MKRFFILITILATFNALFAATSRQIDIEYSYQLDKNWIQLATTERESVKALLHLLLKSSTGKKIIAKAKQKARRSGKTLLDVIVSGEGSLCDTTLTRKFYPSSPDKTVYIASSMVYINKNLMVADAVLDLAHELTHFTYREPFNPYRLNFTLEGFIKSTVEGKGGEVEAYMVECKVLDELFHRKDGARNYCEEIRDVKSGRVTKKRTMEQFYKVGSYFDQFIKEIANFNIAQENLPLVNDGLALFISSAYGVPYPVAAYKEYINIMERSCENDLKRLAVMKQRVGRAPASGQASTVFSKMKRSYQKRCMNLFVDRL